MTTASGTPRRVVIFGVTGQVGQELVEQLDDSEWPIGELIGVASSNSAGQDFEFRNLDVDVLGEWPKLAGNDLVFICTGGVTALEIVRECLRAEIPCIDLSGALSAQAEVPLPFVPEGNGTEALQVAPLLATPSATALAWSRVLSAVEPLGSIKRVSGIVLSSAAAHGRKGMMALSEESVALFNQAESPTAGPAGQSIAFDVIPGGVLNPERVRKELAGVLGEKCALNVVTVQVPAFVGEGAALSIEFAEPVEAEGLVACLESGKGIQFVSEGIGSRGLAAVEAELPEPAGPTMRDAAGQGEVLVGRLAADPSLPDGYGWQLFLTCDPLRITADHALRIAGVRLGLA